MNEDERLKADLAQLRGSLRAMDSPPPDEAAVRAAFREKRRRRAQAAAAAQLDASWRLPVAAAAVVVLAIAAVLGALLFSVERPVMTPTIVREPVPAPLTVAAFQPLQNAPALLPSDSYSVVRVRIPLSAFALVPGSEQDGTVEADLLVGEDGLARGIRFMPADATYAAADAR